LSDDSPVPAWWNLLC